MNFSKYFEIAKVNFLTTFAYSSETAANIVFLFAVIFVFVNLWGAIFRATGSIVIEGYTATTIIWYLLVTESVLLSTPNIAKDVDIDVKTGEIAYTLNKPYNYVLYRYMIFLGESVPRFFLTFMIGAIVLFIFMGMPSFSPFGFLVMIPSAIFAFTLDYLIGAMIGITAFWLEDVSALRWLYMKLVFVIGGMLIPLELLPKWLADISKMLPFAYISYAPAKIFVDLNLSTVANIFLMQLLWVGIFAGILVVVYRAAVKNLSINGG
jgi:ABC-2 type transport system permease protein